MVGGQLIQALVVEHRHQRGVGRLAVRPRHGERPLFLLSWRQTVAEGLPRQFQVLVGQGALDMGRVAVAHVLLHPGEGQQDAVAPRFLIGQFAVDQFVALVDGARLDAMGAGEDAVDDMYVLTRRAYLDGHGLAVVGELAVRHPEPVVGLVGWPFVVEREDHKVALLDVILVTGLDGMPSALQFGQGDGLMRVSRHPRAAVDAERHLGVDVDTCGIAQMEGGGRLALGQHLVLDVDAQGRLAVA